MSDAYTEGYELMLREDKEEAVLAAAKCASRTLAKVRYDRTIVGELLARRIVIAMKYHGYLAERTRVSEIFPQYPDKLIPVPLSVSDPMSIIGEPYAQLLVRWVKKGWTSTETLKSTLEDKKHKFSGNYDTERQFRKVIYHFEQERADAR